MTEDQILARRVGLGAPWKDRGAEIAEAQAAAAKLTAAVTAPADERTEPTPPFAVPGARR